MRRDGSEIASVHWISSLNSISPLWSAVFLQLTSVSLI
uniref:Uncharacterized protein n=1 Tax=Anguilla anguilla TaxID=7936 RepID=A0A0E9UKQ4_ANGAN